MRTITKSFCIFIILLDCLPLFAVDAEKALDLTAKVTLPAQNSLVKADIPVWGLACGKDFKEFRLEYGEGIEPLQWTLINKSVLPVTKDVCKEDLMPDKQPFTGNLGTWETGLTSYYYKDYNVNLKGTYTLRLIVTDNKGNTAEDRKTVEVGDVITNVFGGSAESRDGRIELVFDEHSLYESFLVISIKPVEDVKINLPYQLIGKVYEIKPAGTGFNREVLLKMRYDSEAKDLDEDKLGIYICDSKEWKYLNTIVDKENKTVSAGIEYFPPPMTYCAIFHSPTKEVSPAKQFEKSEAKLSNWTPWKGTILEKNGETIKMINNQWGGYFGVNVLSEGFNAKESPIIEFDYKITPDVKVNMLIKAGGRWYDIVFTDNPKQYLRTNMKKLGEINNVKADDIWHHAQFNLCEALKKYTKETFVERIIFADFDSDGYIELKSGFNSKDAVYYISNFCIRKARQEEYVSEKEINYTSWQIGDDDGTNDDLAYEKYEGQFKDSDTSDDYYIVEPQGAFERAVAFNDPIVNIYFSLTEEEAKNKYLFYIDVLDCDLRKCDYVKFGVYINDKLIDTYACYLKKGQLYAVPIEKNLKSGQNKITIKWLEGGNWISWDYVKFQPVRNKEEIKVSIKKDKIYVNGEEFLVKGIGYSPCRPGDLPWKAQVPLKTMENDFRLIKEAGFNTIRTWRPLTEDELMTARQWGLMVIQGIWIDPITDPLRDTKSENLSPFTIKELEQHIDRFKKFDNILLYLLGNEIPVDNICRDGCDKTEKIFNAMKNISKEADPYCRTGFANWPQVLFLDNSLWDIVCYNLYSYYPATISHSLGYYGILQWIKNNKTHGKPFIVTEYGSSVSKSGPGNKGYGGNTPDQQKESVISMWDDITQSGICGGCLFEWNDEWWKNFEYGGDENSHNNEPEEWFGILGIEGNKEDYTEKLRPVYYAIKEYNQAIIIEPRKDNIYGKTIPIKIYSTENVCSIKYRIDDSAWKELKHVSSHWWRGEWGGNDKDIAPHILDMEAVDRNDESICQGTILRIDTCPDASRDKYCGNCIPGHARVISRCKKQIKFWTGLKPSTKQPGYTVSIDSKDSYAGGEKPELIKVLFKVVDENKKPVNGVSVNYSFYETRLWEQVSGKKTTNENGYASVDYYIREQGYIIVAAGVDCEYKGFKKICGDIKFIEVLLPRDKKAME